MTRCASVLVICALMMVPNIWGAIGIEPAEDTSPIIMADRSGNVSSGGLYGGVVTYDDVALLVNDNSPVSLEIGTYFALKRGIPPLRVINLSVPARETINSGEFDELARQVKENLSQRGLTDSIDYLVTTKGVPLRVSGSQMRMASVDSELMLLDGPYENRIHGNYWMTNPYFDKFDTFSREKYGIRLVTRLTGYTKEEAMNLLDLADGSLGQRGRALLDMDPGKDGNAGYKIANDWMRNAHYWLTNNGYESLLDENGTFRTSWTNTSAYYSWGSNDGNWNMGLIRNGGFESGTGSSPSDWTLYNGSKAERTQEARYEGSWSLKLVDSLAVQTYEVDYPGHRFILNGRAAFNYGDGFVRVIVKGLDINGNVTYYKEIYNRTYPGEFRDFQGVIENGSGVVRLEIRLESLGDVVGYFDSINLRVIRPHNQWVPGAIAETCVSTGGRSMTYGTTYGQSLVADLIRDGVTGVKGYTWEPYLSAVSHADILFPAYYQGYNLAESFWMGSEYGSWMGTVIGDPKCAPYINVRPDMGFNGTSPISAKVDDEGSPYIELELFNKGLSPVKNGLVELFMDGILVDSMRIDIAPGSSLSLEYGFSRIGPHMQGVHDLEAVLNSDASFLEYDPNNNFHTSRVRVNTIPSVSIITDRVDVYRTGSVIFDVTVMDPDGDMENGSLALDIGSPPQEIPDAELIEAVHRGNVSSFRYELIVPYDAMTGLYTVKATYTDPQGSRASGLLDGGSFRVLNALPTLLGFLNVTEVNRGTPFSIDLAWYDPDTPDGNLTVKTTLIGSTQRRIHLESPMRTSNNTGSYTIYIPVEYPSQTWNISSEAVDADGAVGTWYSEIRTVNGAPFISIITSPPFEVTRLDVLNISFTYNDPEGLQPEDLNLEVIEISEDDITAALLSDRPRPVSGSEYASSLNCRYLPVGTYSIVITAKDDENAVDRMELHDALKVVNIPASILNLTVAHSSYPSGVIFRGSYVTVTVEAVDPDDAGFGPRLTGHVEAEGFASREFQMEKKGGNIYSGRIATGNDWPVGPYSIRIEAIDDMLELTTMVSEAAFRLDARMPEPLASSLMIYPNGSYIASAEFGLVSGGSRIVEAYLDMIDAEGREFRIELEEGPTNSVWTASGITNIKPVNATLTMIDHLGRMATYEDLTVIDAVVLPSIEVPKKENWGSLLISMALLLVGIILLIALLLIMYFRRGKRMRPAPPAVGPFDHRIPPPFSGGNGTEALPKASELSDGTIYHPPARRADPVSQTIPVMGEMVPEGSEPSAGDEVAPYIVDASHDGEGINRDDNIAPPEEHVPDTDHHDLPGDSGQGESEIDEGPGLRS
ncbi:MAG: TIGR03790 family protein [Candidatus Thermoplasmatota archaeon]|nr:TIGR03790 family protein [Candidatus Thermoplasmatota archaeon]